MVDPVIVELFTRKLLQLFNEVIEDTLRVDVITVVFIDNVEPVNVE